MNKASFAYQFGISAIMIWYGIAYLWRYDDVVRRHYYVTDDLETGVRNPLDQFRHSISELASLVEAGTFPQMIDHHAELAKLADELIAAHWSDGGFRSGILGHGVCPGQSSWEGLVEITRNSLTRAPGLNRWRRLGEAIAMCRLRVLLADDVRPVPNPQPILEAVAEMPLHVQIRIPEFQRWTRETASSDPDPFAMLGVITGVDNGEVGRVCPLVEMLNQLRLLEQLIYSGLQKLPLFELSVDASDPNQCQVVLDDRPYAINFEQMLFLQALIKADGMMSAKELAQRYEPGLNHARVDRLRNQLPQPIKDLVESTPGKNGGYRLRTH